MTDPAFEGFSPAALTFLEELAANNTRDWFTAHKPTYEAEIKRPAEAFCTEMTTRLADMTGHPHHAKIYRIHRDVRFSKDKTPYNAHLHISFAPDLDLTSPPMWFFGLGTETLSLGCGVFAFDNPALARFRDRLDSPEGAGIAKMVADLKQQGIRISEPDLKRVPPGYPPGHPRAELLRHKGLSGWIDLADRRAACGPDAIPRICDAFTRLRPLYDCLATDVA